MQRSLHRTGGIRDAAALAVRGDLVLSLTGYQVDITAEMS